MVFTIQKFWELVDDIRKRWDKTEDILQDFYIKELMNLSNDEIIIFHHIFEKLWNKLMEDPNFNDEIYFKNMLFDTDKVRMCFIDTIIIKGEKIYIMALRNPEKFMRYHKENYKDFDFLFDCYYYVADNAFYEKNGIDIHEGFIMRKERLEPIINKILNEFNEKIGSYKNSEKNLNI